VRFADFLFFFLPLHRIDTFCNTNFQQNGVWTPVALEKRGVKTREISAEIFSGRRSASSRLNRPLDFLALIIEVRFFADIAGQPTR
jgi:hypothetical protein